MDTATVSDIRAQGFRLTPSEQKAHAILSALRKDMERVNTARKERGDPIISGADVSRERGSTSDTEMVYDRAVLGMQRKKLILARAQDLRAAWERLTINESAVALTSLPTPQPTN